MGEDHILRMWYMKVLKQNAINSPGIITNTFRNPLQQRKISGHQEESGSPYTYKMPVWLHLLWYKTNALWVVTMLNIHPSWKF